MERIKGIIILKEDGTMEAIEKGVALKFDLNDAEEDDDQTGIIHHYYHNIISDFDIGIVSDLFF